MYTLNNEAKEHIMEQLNETYFTLVDFYKKTNQLNKIKMISVFDTKLYNEEMCTREQVG